MRTWTIWKKDGLYGVMGPDTNGRIQVIEEEPTHGLVTRIAALFQPRDLCGAEFWAKLKELFKLHEEN